MTTLKARNVSCSIAHSDRVILRDVSFTVPSGGMTAIVGINGVGKTTLLRVLAGIHRPHSGRVLIDDGTDVHSLRPRDRAQRIAFIGQEEAPPDDLLLGEMVALGRIPHLKPWQTGGKKERDVVTASLEVVGLADKIDHRCDQLSGGERRRAMLTRGLAQDTDLVLLDEPTNHLDVRYQLLLLDVMRASGRTICATIHDLDLAFTHFDHVIVLGDGGVLAAGPPEETLTESTVAHGFSVNSTHISTATNSLHLVVESLRKDTAP